MARKRSAAAFWWRMLAATILAGLGYAGVVSMNWDRLTSLGAPQQEYTEKDLMQCEPGTHQEGQRCVSNPAKPGKAAAPK
ncbi:MAG: hypothetical protein HY077_06695 [Elusimicrobia bacterium]|nr:hypothetical protein [Elusimicrobiota bacterium]